MTSVEDRVGPYRLLAKLGEGGMGVVHRAAGADGREVAVKLVRPEFARDAAFRRRLAREVDTMRRVHSPHVAEIVDADVDAERPYIVTRFIDGLPLDDAVRAHGPLSGRPLGRVAAGLADAITAIHEAGVVHRDLKPNNVMLVGGSPVVIDFGIAHAVDATRLTQTGMIVGTPGYMGPEIISGARPGPPLDVYGWAATVTFAATGRSPFGTGALEAVMARILAGDPALEGVPTGLEPLLREALDGDPGRRPTAAELTTRVREADLGAAAVSTAAVLSGRPPATDVPPETSLDGAAAPQEARSGRRVPLGVYRVIGSLMILIAIVVCAVLPLTGVVMVVLAAWYLRAGDSAVRSGRFTVRGAGDLIVAPARAPGSVAVSTIMLVPVLTYAGIAAGLAGAALSAESILARDLASETITSLTALVFGYVMLAGPGLKAPRRQLVRLLSAVAPDRRATALTGAAIVFGLVLAVREALLTGQHWWPIGPPYGVLSHLTDRVKDLLHRS